MSYLVLVLGGLLSLCGALAIYGGYGIIQVERGWAGVIAGATALSCGIVTIALGFILHRLSGLDTLVKTSRRGAPFTRGVGEAEASLSRPDGGLAFNPEEGMVPGAGSPPPVMSPAAGSQTWLQRAARPSLHPGRNIVKPHGNAVPAAMRPREPDPALPTSPSILPGAASGARNGGREPWLFEEHEGKAPPIEPPFPKVSFAPGEPETQPSPRANWPAETASIEASTPEEFHRTPDRVLEASIEAAEEPLPEALEPASFKPMPGISETEAAARLPDSLPDLAQPATPVVNKETLAIVGRYESDGTSYVMYADGSIEARTERAVFHFNTMGELKRFMESQAQKSRD
jgi:hypothetical protein